jgi:hypothetical protein
MIWLGAGFILGLSLSLLKFDYASYKLFQFCQGLFLSLIPKLTQDSIANAAPDLIASLIPSFNFNLLHVFHLTAFPSSVKTCS